MSEKTPFNWLGALKTGLIGGVMAVLVSLVGMVETFHERDIIAGVISMGRTLLLVAIFLTSYYAARQAGGRRLTVVAAGTLAGAASGFLLMVLVLAGRAINLRAVLVNASPDLFNILTLGQETAVAYVYMLGISAVIGSVAGIVYLLPARARRAVALALVWVSILGVLEDIIRVALTGQPFLASLVTWLFASRVQSGLSILGAIVLFVVIAVANYFSTGRSGTWQRRLSAMPPSRQRTIHLGTLLLVLAILLYLPNILGPYLSEVANTVGIFVLMGLGLNIVVGFAGLLDLGYVAFFAIGAYVMGVLTTTGGELATSFGWSFWPALIVAVACAVLAGVILGIPVLNIRGDYLAIVTLGFGEIIRILALSDFLKPYVGGSQGIVQVQRGQIPAVGSTCLSFWPDNWWPCQPIVFDDPQTLYYLILAGCLLAAFVAIRLKDSRMGRTWMALREDEDVAEAMGIDLVKTKLLAFAAGAAFSGLAGAIFASKLGTIYPHSFNLLISINALALIIVGGMGSIPGVIVGALALVGLPELLREFAEFRLLVYGAVLVAMMLFRPAGLVPEETLKRELYSEEPPAVAQATPATD